MMYLVTKKMVRAKTSYNGITVPAAIAITCPYCSDYLTYSCRDHARHALSDTITFLGGCPSCDGKISFWMANCRDYENAVIFMYPALPAGREVIRGIEMIPDRIAEHYLEALETYRHHYYRASTTMIRASLEAIFKSVADDCGMENLADTLTDAFQKVNLTAKIADIATVIRQRDHLRSLFALDCKPEQQIAATLLDFLEFVIRLIYVVPEEAKMLQQNMDALGQKIGTS